MKCTVIICTHNPREYYLNRVLEGLKNQTLPTNEWELLVVDNASGQNVASKFNISWHPNAKHLREERVGLTYARLCGISVSRGDLLIFVDDDNILKADYLKAAIEIGISFPWLGAWGGTSVPEFEVQPPVEIKPWLSCLAIHTISEPVWAKLRFYSEACPCGAGMTVRRKLAFYYRDNTSLSPIRQMLGRSGKLLGSGEDIDLALAGFEIGLGVGRFPELNLTHIIPASRLTVDYLQKVSEGFGYSEVVLGLVHQPDYQAPIKRRARLVLASILLLLKNRTERIITTANLRGKLAAYQELKKAGFFNQKPPQRKHP